MLHTELVLFRHESRSGCRLTVRLGECDTQPVLRVLAVGWMCALRLPVVLPCALQVASQLQASARPLQHCSQLTPSLWTSPSQVAMPSGRHPRCVRDLTAVLAVLGRAVHDAGGRAATQPALFTVHPAVCRLNHPHMCQ